MAERIPTSAPDGPGVRGDPERIVPGTPQWEQGFPDHIQRYRFAARTMPAGARVLDAGCGCGYGAACLADEGAAQVVAVDIAAEALDVARRQFHRQAIVWLQDDCRTLGLAAPYAPFDAVCSLENLEHLQEPERFLRQAARLLKPGGFLVVSTPNRLYLNAERGAAADAPPRNPYHSREYTSQEFRALLEGFFADVRFWHQCPSAEVRAYGYLKPVLEEMWYNPAMRAGRWVHRRLRGRRVPRDPSALLPLAAHRWEILLDDPGDEMTYCFIAVCRRPREGC